MNKGEVHATARPCSVPYPRQARPVKTARSTGRFKIPDGQPWFATAVADVAGPQPLSREARTIRDLALSFPEFQVPGLNELLQFHRDVEERTGSGYRPYGEVRVKRALKELKTKGFYGIRMTSNGRAPKDQGGKTLMAYARWFSNVPDPQLRALSALSREDIRWHDRATREAWARYEATGHFVNNVVNLEERRLGRAG